MAIIIKEAAEIINHTNDSNKSNKNETYSKETVELINDRRNMKIKNNEDEKKKADLNKNLGKWNLRK